MGSQRAVRMRCIAIGPAVGVRLFWLVYARPRCIYVQIGWTRMIYGVFIKTMPLPTIRTRILSTLISYPTTVLVALKSESVALYHTFPHFFT